MKKSEQQLFKLATKFQRKYAQSQSLQEIIQNAASYGESSVNGIMNFPAKLKQQQAYLGLSITIKSGMLGGLSVSVSDPSVDPPQFAATYAQVSEQVKNYLDKNIKGFPQLGEGTQNVSWDYRAGGAGIAQK
jgi:hypothetical protein